MLHQEAQHNLILPFKLELVLYNRVACDLDTFASHKEVGWSKVRLDVLMVAQVFEQEFLIVVGLLLVDIEVSAIEVE